MQHLAGALGYGGMGGLSGNGSMSSRHQGGAATVLVSQPSTELTDRMYADLIDSFRYSREAAEKRALDAEHRAQVAETRLHELYCKLSTTTTTQNAVNTTSERETTDV